MGSVIAKIPARWRRRLLKAAGALLILLVVFLISAPRLIGWIIGHELRSQLSTRMNARLDFSRVLYQYPYGVLVEKAHLLMPATHGGVDSWVDIGRLELTLAKLPLGSGPLVIEKLAIDHPTVHLSSSMGASSTGSVASGSAGESSSSSVTQKLSELFQLRNVSVSSGRFEYDFSQAGQAVPPIVWGNLNVNMNTRPDAGGLYRFAVVIQDQPVVAADVTGSFDIDSLELNAEKVNVTFSSDPARPAAQIPPQGQAFIRQYQVAGQLSVQGTASVPLHSAADATFTADVDLTNAHCRPRGFAAPITPTLCSIHTTKQTGPCQFEVNLKDQDLAEAVASGSVDLQTLVMELRRFSVKLHCDPGKPTAQLPASVADALGKMKTGGEIDLDGVARLPVLAPMNGWYVARASLEHGQFQPVGWSGPVTAATVLLYAGNVALPNKVLAKSASPAMYPVDLPKDLPGTPVDSHVYMENFTATCGNQLLKIRGGEIVFNPVESTWTARKFQGVADVGDGPGPLEGASARLYVPFVMSGNGKGMDPTSSVRLALDDASAVLTPNHIHLNRINGMFTVTPGGLVSSGLVARCAEGIINARVHLNWAPAPDNGTDTPPVALAYDGDLHIQQVDLHQLAMQYTTDAAVRQEAFGQLDFNSSYRGSILRNSPPSGPDSAADRFGAQGDVDITHGHFIDIPVLRDLLIAMHSPGGSTVGEAAAMFDISRSVVNLDRTGASSPALGIQGSGTITFDKQVNMIFVATPLADWAKDVRGAGIFSDVGAAIVGKAQDVVNGLQRAIYQFRVTGDLSKPKVDPVVIPFLSDKMGPLFQKMAGDQSQGSVAEGLKQQKSDSAGK